MAKFIVKGKVDIDFEIEVEGEDQEDAESIIGTMDVSCADDICATTWEVGIDVYSNETVCVASVKWEALSKLDRANALVKLGISDDCAYDLASREEAPSAYTGIEE